MSGTTQTAGSESPKSIAAFTDLIFGARIRAAVVAHGMQAVVTTVPDRLVKAVQEGARSVFVDLDVRAADPVALIARLKADDVMRNTPVVAFASHVRTDLIEAAGDAGADLVLARGAFARQLPDLVRQAGTAG